MARVTMEATTGIVTAPRPGSAWVAVDGREVLARNTLNVRPPPGSRVMIARDALTRRWLIVGRSR